MKIQVVIDFDRRAKSYAAYCSELPGCASCGDTQKEPLKNIREAIVLYLRPSPIKLPSTSKIAFIRV